MKAFVKDVLSERGRGSSKRVAFFIVLFVFLGLVLVSTFTGKQPAPELREELFYIMSGLLASVVGSNAINAWKEVKTNPKI